MAWYLISRSPWASLEGEVEDEVCTCNPIDFDNLRLFICENYMHVSSEDWFKLDPDSEKCVFVGYAKSVNWFELWHPIKNKMVINIDVILDEQLMLKQSVARNVSTSKGETSIKQVIQVDVHPRPVNNM